MTATKPKNRAGVTREFRHPLTWGEQSLTYRVTATGHVIIHRLPAGETVSDMPEVYRYADVDQARLCWKVLQDRLYAAGYERS
jgi:hypothetical protein